ncbi:hypothetical protein [Calycomorphotria hydatis]|uniref:Uncharacterized protein n=1 Tax=Calycomorphotria hydatis TaxID=2528027 RepID=A0A517T950_9PLAN|nr:hypothetical protein [Calycomorphotria hydatis]QDT64896.1 hypothetical protein V22_21390 [Calycomorphotria hydatis]
MSLFLQRISILLFLLLVTSAHAEEKFRTDEGNKSEPWYQLKPGEFPPENSSHYFAGDIYFIDALDRNFLIRPDRIDAYNRGFIDIGVYSELVPYSQVYFHGARASLFDIPLRTHMHGEFYVKDTEDERKPLRGFHGRTSPEEEFRRCFRIEDDFSFYSRQSQLWRIDEFSEDKTKLTMTLVEGDKEIGTSKIFDFMSNTRVWQGRQVVTGDEIEPGQKVLFNLTWSSLYGPGRIVDLWLDQESRDTVVQRQHESHKMYISERGIPAWIDEVDNKAHTVTVTFFDTVDSSFFKEIFAGRKHCALAVADKQLRLYDPFSDRKICHILDVTKTEKEMGSSGIQICVKVDLMLEGFRPGENVRLFPKGYGVKHIPREEEIFAIRP